MSTPRWVFSSFWSNTTWPSCPALPIHPITSWVTSFCVPIWKGPHREMLCQCGRGETKNDRNAKKPQKGQVQKLFWALTAVTQWLESPLITKRVADSIPSHSTCLDCGFILGPGTGMCEPQTRCMQIPRLARTETTNRCFSPSLFLSVPSSLSLSLSKKANKNVLKWWGWKNTVLSSGKNVLIGVLYLLESQIKSTNQIHSTLKVPEV